MEDRTRKHKLTPDPEALTVEAFEPAVFVDVAETTSSPTPETTDGPWFRTFARITNPRGE